MIAGIGGGAGGGSAVEYITDEKRHEIDGIEYRNLASDTPVGAKREMLALAVCSEKCEKPIMHTFLSWPPDERPSKEQMFAAMDLYLEKLGLADRQAVYAIHHEKGHLHVHAAVNRVGSEGNAWETWRSKTRAMAVVREVERELGFQELGPTRKVAPRTNDAQAERLRGQGIEPTHIVERNQRRFESLTFADSIRPSAAPAITRAASWPEVHANLRDLGLQIVEYKGANAKRTGFEIVEPLTSERCAASKINKTCGRKQLEARLGVFDISAERTVERAQPVAVPIPQALRIVELHRTRERVSEHLANVYRDALERAYQLGLYSVHVTQEAIGNVVQIVSQAVTLARDFLTRTTTIACDPTPVVVEPQLVVTTSIKPQEKIAKEAQTPVPPVIPVRDGRVIVPLKDEIKKIQSDETTQKLLGPKRIETLRELAQQATERGIRGVLIPDTKSGRITMRYDAVVSACRDAIAEDVERRGDLPQKPLTTAIPNDAPKPQKQVVEVVREGTSREITGEYIGARTSTINGVATPIAIVRDAKGQATAFLDVDAFSAMRPGEQVRAQMLPDKGLAVTNEASLAQEAEALALENVAAMPDAIEMDL